MEKEVLRHLGYLREMIKENNGRLLGELDHPEGRFDIQMKEASHMITDLWYDDNTKCVMGKLKVLDTPNGKTLKSLIDAGFPLYVSSRAAGDVNEKTKEVEIAQIFTYDVVCTPGFKEARLERVNESLLTPNAVKYLNESVGNAENAEVKDIDVPECIINESDIARFNNIKASQLTKPLFEDEDMSEDDEPEKIDGQEVLNDVKNFYPTMGTDNKADIVNEDDDNADEKKEDEKKDDDNADEKKDEDTDNKEDKDELSDSEKEENREQILSIVGLDNDGEPIGASADDKNNSEKEDKKDEVENIEGVKKEEEKEEDDEKKDEEKEEEKKEDDEKKDDEKVEESDDVVSEESKNLEKEADKKIKGLKNETNKDLAEIDSILDSVKKAEDVKESIIRRYPFAISLSEANFAKFAQLRPNQKKRCAEFIEEHDIFDIRMINELWTTPLRADKKMQQNWLRLASQSDIDLYVAAPVEVQNMIEESAQLYVLDTQEEVDNFWNNTGLRQEAYRKAMNERMMNDFKQSFNSKNNADPANAEVNALNEQCGYNINDYIAMTERMMN